MSNANTMPVFNPSLPARHDCDPYSLSYFDIAIIYKYRIDIVSNLKRDIDPSLAHSTFQVPCILICARNYIIFVQFSVLN